MWVVVYSVRHYAKKYVEYKVFQTEIKDDLSGQKDGI